MALWNQGVRTGLERNAEWILQAVAGWMKHLRAHSEPEEYSQGVCWLQQAGLGSPIGCCWGWGAPAAGKKPVAAMKLMSLLWASHSTGPANNLSIVRIRIMAVFTMPYSSELGTQQGDSPSHFLPALKNDLPSVLLTKFAPSMSGCYPQDGPLKMDQILVDDCLSLHLNTNTMTAWQAMRAEDLQTMQDLRF